MSPYEMQDHIEYLERQLRLAEGANNLLRETLEDRFAMAALNGLLANPNIAGDLERAVIDAKTTAGRYMAERSKK